MNPFNMHLQYHLIQAVFPVAHCDDLILSLAFQSLILQQKKDRNEIKYIGSIAHFKRL